MSPFRPDITFTGNVASHSQSRLENGGDWLNYQVMCVVRRITLVAALIYKARVYMCTCASTEHGLQEFVGVLSGQLDLARAQLAKELKALETRSPVTWGNVWHDFNLEWNPGDNTLVVKGADGKPTRSFLLPTTTRNPTSPPPSWPDDNGSVGAGFARFATELVAELARCERVLWVVPGIVEQLRLAQLRPSEDPADELEKKMKNISLLGEYNEVKDIGQQLIGLVAENRGVPVGILYQDSQYGVDAMD